MRENTDDLVRPFQLDSSHLRGRLVRLGPALDRILHQHAYPEPVAQLLAEAVVIASALASALKYDGVFTLQTKSDGPVRMLVADVTSEGGIRAYAQYDKDKVHEDDLLGKGYLAFTCSLVGQEDRYQGIVALEGDTLAEAVQHYFRQSEQVPTGIMAAASRDAQGQWRGGCLLLQRMPREGGIIIETALPSAEAEDWTRAMIVMGTCTVAELTDPALTTETLLYRLFHEEGVRVYDPHFYRHQCRCSQQRVVGMLRSLPRTEIEEMAENGVTTVTCEFCNKSYVFKAKDLDEVYGEPAV
jgi:molecular chaperone Hsp33